ncbi:MAG: hypothetical protein GEU94_01670 [Micromonosporaceae bacterium]|nr:hypothetical protein [Micromonosporaceae bacterium]
MTHSASAAEPSGPGEPVDPADQGGESVCWLPRVCPECGRLADAEPPTTCERCGAAIGIE